MDDEEFENWIEENGVYDNKQLKFNPKRNSLGALPSNGDSNGKLKPKRKRPNSVKDDDEYMDAVQGMK